MGPSRNCVKIRACFGYVHASFRIFGIRSRLRLYPVIHVQLKFYYKEGHLGGTFIRGLHLQHNTTVAGRFHLAVHIFGSAKPYCQLHLSAGGKLNCWIQAYAKFGSCWVILNAALVIWRCRMPGYSRLDGRSDHQASGMVLYIHTWVL